MINILATLYLLTIMVVFWIFIPFLFDLLVLDGMLREKLKSWIETRLSNSCNSDCNQGRTCSCKNSSQQKVSGEIVKTHKSFDPHAW